MFAALMFKLQFFCPLLSRCFVPHRLSLLGGRSSSLLYRYQTGEALLCRKSYYHTLSLSENNDVMNLSTAFSFSARSHDKTDCCCCSNSGKVDLYPKIWDGRENIREAGERSSLNFLSKDNDMKIFRLRKKSWLLLAGFFKLTPQQPIDHLESLFTPQQCRILSSGWSKKVD